MPRRPLPPREQMMQGRFNLEDFLEQLREMRKLGPIQDLLKMLPGVPGGKNADQGDWPEAVDEAELRRAEAIILSMTPEERRNPAIISGSRRLRIADGSGTTTADVNQLLKDFEGARKMMRSMMGGKRAAGDGQGPRHQADRPRRRTRMATRIRLRRMGSNKRPFYRVVVADQRAPATGASSRSSAGTTR